MNNKRLIRHTMIGILLFLGVCWSLSQAARDQAETEGAYPNSELLASPEWLQQHLNDENLVIVDVREDKYFNDELIPGAVRLPWRTFRYNNTALHVGSVFVGVEDAQHILGDRGILPGDTVVLYDSVERDGGATASYVFWVLDMLGHSDKKILNGGIDAWKQAGGETVSSPAEREAMLYQVDPNSIHPRLWADGQFIYERLGDPYYQIIDVRSPAEYTGEKGNVDLNGNPLKLGHIPTALNIEYKNAWTDKETKRIKPYAELQQVYRGIDPDKATVVYCHSGRRSSFSYFIMRLMGFADPIEYEGSWNQWGRPGNYFPAQLKENRPAGNELPGAASKQQAPGGQPVSRRQDAAAETERNRQDPTGYVSCGG